jgi:toxin ParE1/3/4
VAEYRLAAPAEAQIDQILSWSQDRFGDQATERYAALLVTAMQDGADDPEQVTVTWKRLGRVDVGVYHVSHSRDHVPDPPGPLGEPRHYLVFRVGLDGIVDILEFIHERMLFTRALRQIARSNTINAIPGRRSAKWSREIESPDQRYLPTDAKFPDN